MVLNRKIDLAAAKIIAAFKSEQKSNIDIVAAPQIEPEASELLWLTRKTMGIYTFEKILPPKQTLNPKWVEGGFILQTPDRLQKKDFDNWEVATATKPLKKQLEQMKLGWQFISRIRSNAVIVVDQSLPMTRGIGSGQTSRFRSTQIALDQAREKAIGGILVSDSFFPFSDSVRLAAKYKIGAIVQQGGSVNDQSSIKAAEKAGIPMVFTHKRAFWH